MSENLKDTERGFYIKYDVKKKEGETDPEAVYLVLRLDTDGDARSAADYYATLIKKSYPQYSDDLVQLIQKLEREAKIECSVCQGTGETDDYSECLNCGGTGAVD